MVNPRDIAGNAEEEQDTSNININNDNNNYNNNSRIERRYSRFFTMSSQRRELSPARTFKEPGRNRV